uniref:rRNA adenine N-6-methyltransferase family protein n=1 Tax=Bacillus altitudinis TaxID=293387 RepID=UPI003B52ABC0
TLAQNFLIPTNILHPILHHTQITDQTPLIQIPPPIPPFTQHLPKPPNKLTPFQIHHPLFPILNHTLSPYHNLTI